MTASKALGFLRQGHKIRRDTWFKGIYAQLVDGKIKMYRIPRPDAKSVHEYTFNANELLHDDWSVEWDYEWKNNK
jgi:hypothetical protein